MDNYLLSDILIKSIIIMFGCYLVMKGKHLKTSSYKRETAKISPNAMIVLGIVVIVSNGLLLIDSSL